MAGIEKICEYSGDYKGYEMYAHKRDSIQVLPEHLHNFQDKTAVLLFFTDPHLVNYVGDGPSPLLHIHLRKAFNYKTVSIPRFWTRFYWQWRKYGMYYCKPTLIWDYCLYVPDCQGKVEGKYYNHTSNPQRAIKKLSKLVDIMMVYPVRCSFNKFWEDEAYQTIVWEDSVNAIEGMEEENE